MAKQYFELPADDKFWEVWVAGTDLYTRHGKIGSNGQVKIKNFTSAADAKAHQTKVIADKTKEGYASKGATKKSDKTSDKKSDKKGASKAKGGDDDATPTTVEVPAGTQRLEFVEGASKKFWQVRRDDLTVTVQFGKIGSEGQTQQKKYKTDWEARSAVNTQLEEKKKKGYALVLTGKQGPQSPVASDPALEKAILANPDSDDGFMVYADWLQEQGDVRGELAAIQAQLAKDPKKYRAAEQKLLWDQRAHFYGPYAVYLAKKMREAPVTATWRQGFMDVLELAAVMSYGDDGAPAVDNVAELVRLLPKVTSAKFIRELILAKPVAEDEYNFATAIKELVKVMPSLPMLKRLTIGKFGYEDSELSWSHLGSLDTFWPIAKQLEYLKIKAGSMTLGKIDAPNLRELRIECGGLDKKSIAAIVTGRMPKLETLSVWFGQENYGFTSKVTELLPFLDKKKFPKVQHLAVANTIWGDELCDHWPTATILPQLETLDLSRSHLTVDGIRKLAAHADAFAHLKSIDLKDCLIDKEGQRLAKTLCKNVDVSKQEDPEEYRNEDDDEDDTWWRYTRVGE